MLGQPGMNAARIWVTLGMSTGLALLPAPGRGEDVTPATSAVEPSVEPSVERLVETSPPSVSSVPPAPPAACAPASRDPLGRDAVADGWAAVHEGGTGVTNGGAAADAAHVYVVSDRSQLIRALYPDAIIADSGAFTSAAGPDPTPKIIQVRGAIDLSVDGSLRHLGFEDFKDPGFDFDAYVAAFKPSVWNANPANWNSAAKKPFVLSGPLETARAASARRQAAIVRIAIGSNTTLIGARHPAGQLINGNLLIREGVDNVVIRNLTFLDAFDEFPTWDPTDTFVVDPTKPGCQETYLDPDTGPQKCPGGRWNSSYDNLSVLGGTHVWIDHCTFSDGARQDQAFPSVFEAPYVGVDFLVEHHDGLVDITQKSNYVTMSFNRFERHDKTNLIGASDTATVANGFGLLGVTVHHNYYKRAGQRMPRVRFGKVHVYDNVYQGTLGDLGPDGTAIPRNRFLYGIGIGYLAKLVLENNVFRVQAPCGVEVPDGVMFSNWHKAAPTSGTGLDVGQKTYLQASGTMLNGVPKDLFAIANAAALAAGKPALESTDAVWSPASTYPYTLDPVETVEDLVVRTAGADRPTD